MIRYEIRAVSPADQDQLLELATHLNSVNLPANPEAIESIVARSQDSFSGVIADPEHRSYVFALHDHEEERVVATSMIFGQLGRRDAPYIFYRVRKEERYSRTLDRLFVHPVLQIAYSYDGPTELGGLVTHPAYRRSPAKIGMMISYVRFLFIAMHRGLFRDELLAELMPPLEADGTSHLWEALGRHFTGMTYREADQLSRKNKEFIRGLFPVGDIYASLLPPEAQAVIGEVGRDTRGVEKMLRRIGFRYANRVDPFDGGPHFRALTDEVSLVKDAQAYRVVVGEPEGGKRVLLARSHDKPPWFQCLLATISPKERETAIISKEACANLDLREGQIVWSLPI